MKVSIIIKALNEERNIERAVQSALTALHHVESGEVILADSLSADRTVDIAARYPIRIVQLTKPEDRSCGVGAEIGYRIASGEYLYILDADMELDGQFLAAAVAELDANPSLAGVGGLVQEMNIVNAEFRGRIAQAAPHMQPGVVDRLNMGGLYRRTRIDRIGYLTNRNLHAFEELELAVRLRAEGDCLKRLGIVAVKHYGHTEASFSLLWRRWRSRYAWGGGELLRSAWGTEYFGLVLRSVRMFRQAGLLLAWLIMCLLAALLLAPPAQWFVLPLLAVPIIATTLRRKSLIDGIYSITFLIVFTTGTLAGLAARSRYQPTAPVPVRIIA